MPNAQTAMNKTKQRERRAIAEPLGLQGKPLLALYATNTLLWKHLDLTESRVVTLGKLSRGFPVCGPFKSRFTLARQGTPKLLAQSNPLFTK
jgi:hypothetical protein